MTPAEWARVLLFIGIIVAVYVLAAGIAVRRFLLRRRVSSPPRHRWYARIVLSLAAIGVLCMAWGYFVEPYWLEVSRVRIASPKLPAGFQPLRIVHISDVHSDPEPRLEDELPEAIAAERPDLIVFTGDAINSPEGLPVFRRLMAALAEIAPTYAVKGNWDAWYWSDQPLFRGTGVEELDGTAKRVVVRGFDVWIGGAAVAHQGGAEAALGALPDGAFTIFLYHYPDLILDAAAGADLYLAGHTHGGQVALPGYGALVTFSRFGKRYEAGLYREGDTFLYVNRGIGMEGNRAPRVRFWARPEVTVIEVNPV